MNSARVDVERTHPGLMSSGQPGSMSRGVGLGRCREELAWVDVEGSHLHRLMSTVDESSRGRPASARADFWSWFGLMLTRVGPGRGRPESARVEVDQSLPGSRSTEVDTSRCRLEIARADF